jgi:hypothetical protein
MALTCLHSSIDIRSQFVHDCTLGVLATDFCPPNAVLYIGCTLAAPDTICGVMYIDCKQHH